MLRIMACICLMLGFGGYAAAQPPKAEPKVTPEQVETLKKREPLIRQVDALLEEENVKKAAIVIEMILVLEQEVLGETHSEVIDTLAKLAAIYELAEDFGKAKNTWQQLLTISEKTAGKDHWRTTDIKLAMKNADLLTTLGADELLQLAKAIIYEKQMGNLYRKGNLDEASVVAEKALRIRKKLFGESHPDYAKSLNNMAFLYLYQGKYSKAKRMRSRPCAIVSESL